MRNLDLSLRYSTLIYKLNDFDLEVFSLDMEHLFYDDYRKFQLNTTYYMLISDTNGRVLGNEIPFILISLNNKSQIIFKLYNKINKRIKNCN
jgi:hypothetical protein